MFLFKRRKPVPKLPLQPVPPEPLRVANLQGIGRRGEQQDAFGLSLLTDYESKGFLAVLCDGMGGMAAGKAIAQRVVAAILERFALTGAPDPEWERVLGSVNGEIYGDYRGMGGSTLIMTYLWENRLWFWCVGDSDLLLLREGRLYAMNRQHEYRNDLFCRVLGGDCALNAAFANPQGGALSQYIGGETVQSDHTRAPFFLKPGDALLLCSDGVSDTLSRAQIQTALALDPDACVSALEQGIKAAALPEQDNYTAIILRYNGKIKDGSKKDETD